MLPVPVPEKKIANQTKCNYKQNETSIWSRDDPHVSNVTIKKIQYLIILVSKI